MNSSNNWYVITGAPYAGKTSVIKLLEEEGYRVVYEAARIYIDQEIKKGRTIKEIRQDELLFQEEILKYKIEYEKKLPKDEIIFFDRGIPDSQAYYNLYGVTNDKLLKKALDNCAYKKVFLFDFLDYEKDYARTENKEQQAQIHSLLEQAYKKINAPLIKVPTMNSKEERLDFILENL